MHKKQWISVLILVMISTLLQGCGVEKTSGGTSSSIPVQVMELASQNDVGFSGKVIPEQEVKIVSKVSGRVTSINAEEGAKVKKGDVLLQLETGDLEKQFRQADAGLTVAKAKLEDTRNGARQPEIDAAASALAQAKAGLENAKAAAQQAESGYQLAKNTYDRIRVLHENGAVSKAELEKSTFEFDKAEAGRDQALAGKQSSEAAVAAAQAKLELVKDGATQNTIVALEAEVNRMTATVELAQSALDNTVITAPIDGIVAIRSVSLGEMVQPGASIVTLVNMDSVQVELSVTEDQIHKFQNGTNVDVTLQSVPGETFPGKIKFISPVSNEDSTTFPVKVTVNNEKGALFAGMIAEVHINGAAKNQVELPTSSLVSKDGKKYVVSIVNGKAHYVEVKPKEKDENWVFVKESADLKSDTQIVVRPTVEITEGTPLETK